MKYSNYISILIIMNSALSLTVPGRIHAQEQKSQQQQAIELKNVTIHFVEAKKTYQYRDSAYKLYQSKTAYMVFMDLENIPRNAGTALNIYIGDYKVPEYGGTPTGIYFRIYDQKILQRLDKQIIYYQIDKGEKRSFNKQFSVPDQNTLKKQSEEELLRSKGKNG